MIKKIIIILILLILIIGLEYKFFTNIIKENSIKNTKTLNQDLSNLDSYINYKSLDSLTFSELLTISPNIVNINKKTTLHEIDLSNQKIKEKLFFVTLVDPTLGTIKTIGNKIYINLKKLEKEIKIKINELNKENEITTKIINIKLKSQEEYKVDIKKSVYDFFIEPYIKTKSFNIKNKNKIIKTYTIFVSRYNLDKKDLEKTIQIFMYLNIFILTLFLILMYIIFIKKNKFLEEETLVKKLKNDYLQLEHIKDERINEYINNNDLQEYTTNIYIKENPKEEYKKVLLLDMLISSTKEKINEIIPEKIESRFLNRINKEIFEFAQNNNLDFTNIVFPIYKPNLSNNEFINWFEYFIVKNEIKDIKLYIKGIEIDEISNLNNLLLRLKNNKILFILDEREKERIGKKIKNIPFYIKKDKDDK